MTLELYDTPTVSFQPALDPAAWTPLLEELSREVDGHGAQLQFVRVADGSIVDQYAPTYSREAALAYLEYYGHISPRRNLAMSLGAGQVFSCSDYFDKAFVSRNEFYQDYAIHLGCRYLLGAMLAQRRGVVAVLGLLRPADAEPFSSDEKERLQQRLPDLATACEVHIELASLRARSEASDTTLAALPYPVFVVDEAAAPVFMNPSAARLLDQGDLLRLRGGKLAPAAVRGAADFTAAIARAVCSGAGGTQLLLCRGRDEQLANVQVLPLPASGWSPPRAMVIVRTTEASPMRDFAAIAAYFGFTPTEARIAKGLSRGDSVADIAAAEGIAVTTVRWHFKSLFAKAGVTRQAELVAALRQLGA